MTEIAGMDEVALRAMAERVLSHPEHADGIGRSTLRVQSVTELPSGLVRVGASIAGVDDPAPWLVPNVTVRLAVPDEGDYPASRVYTIRRFDPATSRADMDFVIHREPSPVMRWLTAVRPGDEIPITGPRQHQLPRFASGATMLLLADSSAVPALASILEQWPADARGIAHVSVARAEELAELPVVPGVAVRPTVGTTAATRPLLDAALSADAASPGFSVWAAGERDEMKAIRSHFRRDAGLPKEAVQVFGYWKRGLSNTMLDLRRVLHLKSLIEQNKGMAEFDEFDIEV